MLSLGASVKRASATLVRDSIRAAMIPTVDAAKTVGLVSLPGMMSGLIFAGIDPMQAIKFQIMVTFMLLGTAAISTIIAARSVTAASLTRAPSCVFSHYGVGSTSGGTPCAAAGQAAPRPPATAGA